MRWHINFHWLKWCISCCIFEWSKLSYFMWMTFYTWSPTLVLISYFPKLRCRKCYSFSSAPEFIVGLCVTVIQECLLMSSQLVGVRGQFDFSLLRFCLWLPCWHLGPDAPTTIKSVNCHVIRWLLGIGWTVWYRMIQDISHRQRGVHCYHLSHDTDTVPHCWRKHMKQTLTKQKM